MIEPDPSTPPNESGSRPVTIKSGKLALEGKLYLTRTTKQPGLIFCHPHPLYGGSMEDARGRALIMAAVPRGYNVLSFNYRGVGRSHGVYGQGHGEVQDTIAAVRFLRHYPHVDESRVALVGYSFGGSVVLAAALHVDPAALVTISAPIHPPNVDSSFITDTLRYIRCPTYILHGRNDKTVPSIDAESIHAQLQGRDKFLHLIRDADHFYTHHLNTIIPMILAFLDDTLRPTDKR